MTLKGGLIAAKETARRREQVIDISLMIDRPLVNCKREAQVREGGRWGGMDGGGGM